MNRHLPKKFWHLRGSIRRGLQLLLDGETDFCALAAELRWLTGCVACPACGCTQVFATARGWKCKRGDCRRHFSVKAGTLFHDSRLPLPQLLSVVWLIVNADEMPTNMISSLLDIAPKTVRRLRMRIRKSIRKGQKFPEKAWSRIVEAKSVAGKESTFWRVSGKLHSYAGAALARRFFIAMSHIMSGSKASSRAMATADLSAADKPVRIRRFGMTVNDLTLEVIRGLQIKWGLSRIQTVRYVVNLIADGTIATEKVLEFYRNQWRFANTGKKTLARFSWPDKSDKALRELAINVLGSRNRSKMFRILVAAIGLATGTAPEDTWKGRMFDFTPAELSALS